jgi:hypothetical protein
MSAKYNLVCEQGATFNFQFVIKNDNTAWNLTNYTATMTVRPFIGATTTVVTASTTDGRIVLDPTNGRITVTINAATTTGFQAARHVYDITLNSVGVVTRILEGKFIVTPGVGV